MPDAGQSHVQMTMGKRAVRFVDAVLASATIDEHFGECLSLRFVVGNRVCQQWKNAIECREMSH